MYYVYILRCADETLYTGIATELERRVEEHNGSGKGAKYTRIRRPVELVYSEEYPDRSLASKREYAIKKKMSRAEKLKLIESRQLLTTACSIL
ncbi:GIY-YIG nuclease family protein [Sulfurovum sp.]|uniref:GIY-YIG nuclease family protein n=1 Tax=Sulfurovum sp. TaxID=1969726 RepID=UPI002867D5C5|nr:GIY-YIG nuclease family protein [Sulfurovum sp.]